MRVLLIQTQAENAGAQEVARLIEDGLSARSHEVRHLFFYRKTAAFDFDSKAVFASRSRPTGPVELAVLVWRLIKEIRRFRPDAVLCFQHYGNILGSLAIRVSSRASIVANQLSAPSVVPRPARWLDKVLGAAGVYDAVVVNSRMTEISYENHPQKYRDRLSRVDHGFGSKQSELGPDAARQRLGLPSRMLLLGCAARLNRSKRLDLAVRLLPMLPSVHLALAGQGPDEPNLKNIASDLNVSDRVHFLGELTSAEIPTFLAALDVFVFPSEAETFGLAGVEAAQAGLPCVVNDLPVLREVLDVEGQSCALFTRCSDLEEFCGVVEEAFAHGPEILEMTNRARRLAHRFPVAEMVSGYETLLYALRAARQ